MAGWIIQGVRGEGKSLAAVYKAREYLKKGSQVYVEGRLQTRKWEDKEGNTRYSTDIIAEKMTMLGSKSDNSNSSDSDIPSEEISVDLPSQDDEKGDLPF